MAGDPSTSFLLFSVIPPNGNEGPFSKPLLVQD